MQTEAIKQILEQHFADAEISVTGDGHHFDAVIISDVFHGINKVKRQQMIYQVLNPYILSGELHAISLKTLTREEHNHG